MSGRKQFDENAILDAAMTLFWARGYQGTSLAELEQATGLNKSSIYNAYHSKEALYTRCLERFGENHGQALLAELGCPDFREAVGRFFDRLFERMECPELPNGCMATFAAVETGCSGSCAADTVLRGLEAIRGVFEARCRRAVEDGDLPADTDVAAMAAALLATTRGVAVLNSGYGDTAVGRAAARQILDAIAGPRSRA